MKKNIVGIIVIVIGFVCLAVVYSLRPPSNFGEMFMMLGQGKQYFINEPVYQIFLIISGLITVFGAILLIKGMTRK